MASSTMTFCCTCDSLMSPMEDREKQQLMYFCTLCGHKEEAGDRTCAYRHSLVAAAQDMLAKVKTDMLHDAALQRGKAHCSTCGNNESVFFQIPTSAADDRLRLIHICTGCKAKWEG